MTIAKRHHWWPQLQSRNWTGEEGLIFVTTRDGRCFQASPANVGVESDLYSRFGESNQRDSSLEEWFSQEIESPFAKVFNDIISLSALRRERFRGDPKQADTVRQVGYEISEYREFLILEPDVRMTFANYLAALLVRHPKYLKRIQDFHRAENAPASTILERDLTLSNMIYVYDIYRQAIRDATITFVKRAGDHEFLFSDGGVSTSEPWRTGPIAFDLHFPLTPEIAAAVFPFPGDPHPERIYLSYAKNRAISRHNRIALGDAIRFVYSRSKPPLAFISKYFGRPAPKPYGSRMMNGRLEVAYDPTRDK